MLANIFPKTSYEKQMRTLLRLILRRRIMYGSMYKNPDEKNVKQFLALVTSMFMLDGMPLAAAVKATKEMFDYAINYPDVGKTFVFSNVTVPYKEMISACNGKLVESFPVNTTLETVEKCGGAVISMFDSSLNNTIELVGDAVPVPQSNPLTALTECVIETAMDAKCSGVFPVLATVGGLIAVLAIFFFAKVLYDKFSQQGSSEEEMYLFEKMAAETNNAEQGMNANCKP